MLLTVQDLIFLLGTDGKIIFHQIFRVSVTRLRLQDLLQFQETLVFLKVFTKVLNISDKE